MDLIKLANQNAAEEVERATTREERQNKLLEALGRMLGLPQAPRRMESYDISNTGADDIVASMVVFENGRPLKRDYRHFKLKDLDGPDDYASMEQVLTRRFRRYLDGDEKFNARPDLLLIDGGGNHVRVACRVLETMGLDIPAFGMVKDDRHRTGPWWPRTGGRSGSRPSRRCSPSSARSRRRPTALPSSSTASSGRAGSRALCWTGSPGWGRSAALSF